MRASSRLWRTALILVLRCGVTDRESAMEAYQRLQEDGVPLLGTVLTDYDLSADQQTAILLRLWRHKPELKQAAFAAIPAQAHGAFIARCQDRDLVLGVLLIVAFWPILLSMYGSWFDEHAYMEHGILVIPAAAIHGVGEERQAENNSQAAVGLGCCFCCCGARCRPYSVSRRSGSGSAGWLFWSRWWEPSWRCSAGAWCGS